MQETAIWNQPPLNAMQHVSDILYAAITVVFILLQLGANDLHVLKCCKAVDLSLRVCCFIRGAMALWKEDCFVIWIQLPPVPLPLHMRSNPGQVVCHCFMLLIRSRKNVKYCIINLFIIHTICMPVNMSTLVCSLLCSLEAFTFLPV